MRLRNFSILLAALSFAMLAVSVFVMALRDDPARPIHVHVAAPTVIPPAVTVNHPQPAEDDGMQVLHLGTSGGESTLAVVRRARNPELRGEMGWTLTYYKFNEHWERGYLRHMGTRYIEHDMGMDLRNVGTEPGLRPGDFRNRIEAARTTRDQPD